MSMITISLTLPEDKLLSVYALLGGTALVAPVGKPTYVPNKGDRPETVTAPVALLTETDTSVPVAPSPVEDVPPPPPVDEEPMAQDAKVDSAGVAFDPALHTGTLKKDGTWRLKKGAAAADETPPPPPPVVDEDDEFAAFASAEVAPAAPAARKWTDADLSKLCNQGASKDGNPDRVKAIIGKYVPANEVQHSRNIPANVREDFAQELESTIGIQYAG